MRNVADFTLQAYFYYPKAIKKSYPKINGEISLDDMGVLQSFWSVPLRQIKMKISMR